MISAYRTALQARLALAMSIAVVCTAALCPLPCAGQTWTPGTNSISTQGSVGIGTTSPVANLTVMGNTAQYSGSTTPATPVGASLYLGDALFYNSSYYNSAPGLSAVYSPTTLVAGDLAFYAYNNAANSRREVMRILNSGNVGIGTTSPQHALGFAYGGLTSDGSSGIGIMSGIYYSGGWKYLNSSTKPATIQLQGDGSTLFTNGSVSGTQGSAVSSGFGMSMMIAPTGNVGIGTTNPTSKLSVNGTITTKEVVVTATGWSDYVFLPAYRLKPLPEVAAYIQQNHHLPGIPSESEVRDNGISLGEMQSKLLAKIEELTLHAIQLDQQNRDLQERLARLEGVTAPPRP